MFSQNISSQYYHGRGTVVLSNIALTLSVGPQNDVGLIFSIIEHLFNLDWLENINIHSICHTLVSSLSSFSSEYQKRLALYKQEIWTCQCTGHLNMTHEEAYSSEQEKYTILQQSFPSYFEKPVLEIVHHSE